MAQPHSSQFPQAPDDFEALRRVLLEPEQKALSELQDPQTWVRQVAEALPEALVRRAKSDADLQRALSPVLEESFALLIRRNPKEFVEILFPVMLPAIRRAVASMFSSLVQSFNQTLDQAFSPRGLRWRFEALTTGKSFAEVVLSHTLLYRVEQALLIHRESGLLLSHVVAEGVNVQDGAMVSGMLTAIGDFVKDSFDPNANLNTVNLGERVLAVEQAPSTVLAVVVRGSPPQELKDRLQDVLSEVHMRFGQEIEDYSGKDIEGLRPLLESLLETRYQESAAPRRPPYALIGIGVLLLAGLLWWGLSNYQASRNWKAYLDRLRSTPGIVLTEAPRRYEVAGLRDPLAPDPTQLTEGLNLPQRIKARWQPYQSLEPEMILRRLRQTMTAPQTVQLTLQGEVLTATGSAPEGWLERLRQVAPAYGIGRFDLSGVNQLGQRWEDLKRGITSTRIGFEAAKAQILPRDQGQLASLMAQLQELSRIAKLLDRKVRVQLVGHADGQATPEVRAQLAQARAKVVAGQLPRDLQVETGYTLALLRPERTPEDQTFNRVVTIELKETAP